MDNSNASATETLPTSVVSQPAVEQPVPVNVSTPSKFRSMSDDEFKDLSKNNKSIFKSKGRMSRQSFIFTNLVIYAGLIATYVVLLFALNFNTNVGGASNTNSPLFQFAGLIGVVAFVIFVNSQIKRLHDLGYSAWWFLVNFIPFATLLLTIYLMCIKGVEGDNKYGVDPLVKFEDRK